MSDYVSDPDWNNYCFNLNDQPETPQYEELLFNQMTGSISPIDTSNPNTPTSIDTVFDSLVDNSTDAQSRKRQHSECSQSEVVKRPRKNRVLKSKIETNQVRKKGACFFCQKKRKKCTDGDTCRPCLERSDKITVIPGLLRPLCWRPNIGCTEVFRRGPTIDFSVSQRGHREDAGPGKQALWKDFKVTRSGRESCRTVELSQDWTPNTLSIRLDRYLPKDTDKQHYTWFDNGVEKHYQTPPYGISNMGVARAAIERFLVQNFEGYIDARLREASEITRKTFETALCNKNLPLVERALNLWVGCRFIEKPWSIVGSETLGMSRSQNSNCPYHEKTPVPPIVDLQIDLIVINQLLQPQLKQILQMLKEMLESSDPWTNWFEIYLAYFVLLHNVELTMAHDAWFVKRNNLKTRYSNKPLVDTITQGATTLLTCFHYAHQGYAPFSNLELEHTQGWTVEQKEYLRDIRVMLHRVRGDHVQDPARELFWTSQLHKPDWRPVLLVC